VHLLSEAAPQPTSYGLALNNAINAPVDAPTSAATPTPAAPQASPPQELRLVTRVAAPPTAATSKQEFLFQDAARNLTKPLPDRSFARTSSQPEPASAAAWTAKDSVLVSFKVQPVGDLLRIIDGDGSIYSGFLERRTGDSDRQTPTGGIGGASVGRNLALRPVRTPGSAVTAGVPTYLFHVTGTNKTLNQKVDFTGRITPLTNGVAPRIPSITGATTREGAPRWLVNSKIEGKALVNDRQQFEVNAAPAGP
ncbi:MAG TPA: hypothetical protein VJA21_34040, partial [Verrucomicrobiae bacterium]